MVYRCLALTAEVVPATAKQNAGNVYFQAQYVPKDDKLNTKLIKVNLFPTTQAQIDMYQELVDNEKLLDDEQYVKVTVSMPDYRMRDRVTNTWIAKIYDSMDVYVRLIPNDEWFEGSNLPKMVREHDVKRLAERTVENLGEFIKKSTHEVEVVNEVAEQSAAPVAPVAAAPAAPAMPTP